MRQPDRGRHSAAALTLILIAPAAYEAISEDIPYALLPAENSTHGYVVDTYDILRLPDLGARVRVHGETTLRIAPFDHGDVGW